MKLQRLTYAPAATFGQLVDDENREVCKTLELPWKDNAHDVSCIPIGTYTAHRRLSPKRGYVVFELDGVPGRANIQIHIGNLPKDTDGCVLVGRRFGQLDGQDAVIESKDAFTAFMAQHPEDSFRLTVLAPPEIIAAA